MTISSEFGLPNLVIDKEISTSQYESLSGVTKLQLGNGGEASPCYKIAT
jgi:hypothetical protein